MHMVEVHLHSHQMDKNIMVTGLMISRKDMGYIHGQMDQNTKGLFQWEGKMGKESLFGHMDLHMKAIGKMI